MKKRGFLTIGYGNMGIREFIEKIKKCKVTCIVDVRARPYSKYNLSFNKEELRDRLAGEGISYFWMGNKLGGRYDKIKYCDKLGRVDYTKVAMSETFIDGIKELEKHISRYNVCVMCSESNPLRCHRFLLISRALKEYNIVHVTHDSKLIKNAALEQILFDMYGNAEQVSIFDDNENFEDIAYREQGLKTSYVSEKVKELLSYGIDEDPPEKIKIYCIGCENKTAEQFFNLLKEYRVKRIVDIRRGDDLNKTSFAVYPDIAYFLKTNCISYEKNTNLVPNFYFSGENNYRTSKFRKEYSKQIDKNNILLELLSDELDGTCFLGYEEDYQKCYRNVLIKKLKQNNPYVRVRHIK